jgi:integrase
MKVDKREISYKFKSTTYRHHVVYLCDGEKKILLSPFNLFLKDRASSSLETSARYAGNLCRFLNFILERYQGDHDNFWRNASNEDLREWQQTQVRERDLIKNTKPSDKTISDNAALIHDVYDWLKLNNFPISMYLTTKDWRFNFKSESLLKHVRSQLSGKSVDHSSISVGFSRTGDRNKRDFTIMSLTDREMLLGAYKDPVYSACFMLALGTGMREEGICKMPYLGNGENFHIRPYPEILAEIGDKKTFEYSVVEKRKKRTVLVNLKAWEAVCHIYLPHYFMRRKLLQKKYPDINPDSVFFINRLGHPVTPKMISSMTYVAKQDLIDFPWSFHSARPWYATQYMINNLSKNQLKAQFYNAAVEDGLRKQLGHSDIKTTYMYYIKMALVVSALLDGSIGQKTWKDLEETADSVILNSKQNTFDFST